MTATLDRISPQELRRSLDELEALELEQTRRDQAALLAAAERDRERRAADRERTLDAIDVRPYDAAVWDALDNLEDAARALIQASAQRELVKTTAVETIAPYVGESQRVRGGPVPSLDGYRLTSNRKEEITEVCRIIAPVIRAIGGATEHLTQTAVENRGHRGGNRLQRGTQHA